MEGERRLETGVRTRLTPPEGRKFALTVGIAFAVLGGISRWRGHTQVPLVLWAVGGALVLAGILIPGKLDPVYRAWMGLAHAISRVTTPIFMGIVYFLVVTPIALVMRVFGYDPLQARASGSSRWRARDVDRRRSNLQRQF
jgi:hypothetical protein